MIDDMDQLYAQWITVPPEYDQTKKACCAYAGLTFSEFMLSMGYTEDDYMDFMRTTRQFLQKEMMELRDLQIFLDESQ